ncbi:MAG: 2-C-methyl-D-erythritol 4-phosphate cytidylyltransferase [bacterium]|nr:2-C-methyl-D-erythritol 4-phosphate cytidylyltransferase [bacterium]
MSEYTHNKTAAVIVAGGKGIRLDAGTKKQYLEICGHPVLMWTLSAFLRSEKIGKIALVVPEEDTAFIQNGLIYKYGIEDRVKVVEGGNTRQESVFNGLRSLDDDIEFTAIHDGVRPLIRPDLIDSVCETAERTGAALIAVKSTASTFIGRDNEIEEYIDRNTLWFAQTPQAFNKDSIIKAHNMAVQDKFEASDDGMIYKKYIGDVDVVEGDHDNIKITYARDLVFAENILKDRELF